MPSFGIQPDKTLTHSFAGKLSWRATNNLNLVITITGDPTERDAVGRGVNVPPAALTNPDPYLQNIVDHIGMGIITIKKNGEVDTERYAI